MADVRDFPDWVPPDDTTKGRGGGGGGGGGGGKDKSTDKRVAGYATRLPIVYGTQQVQGKLQYLEKSSLGLSSTFYFIDIHWCEGPVYQIVRYFDGNAFYEPDYFNEYLGEVSQDPDPDLERIIGSEYKDNFVSEVAGRTVTSCHTVFRHRPSHKLPDYYAEIKGCKVYNPLTDETLWSNNPALCAGDFVLKAGVAVNWEDSTQAIERCAELLDDDNPRWTINITIDKTATLQSQLEFFEKCGHFMAVPTSAGIAFVADYVPTTYIVLDPSRDMVRESLKLNRKSIKDRPTVVEVTYTDLAPDEENEDPQKWGTKSYVETHPGVISGDLIYNKTSVNIAEVHNEAEAVRAAKELLNTYTLRALEGAVTLRDIGLKVLEGSVIEFPHPLGFDNFRARVLNNTLTSPGRWSTKFEEYSEDVYSDEVAPVPDDNKTNLPNPWDVVPPTNIVVSEVPFVHTSGEKSVQLNISWDSSNYPYPATTNLTINKGGSLFESSNPRLNEYTTKIVEIGSTYTINLSTVANANGIESDLETVDYIVQGIDFIPDNVENLEVRVIGGEVIASYDYPQFDDDISGVRIKFVPIGQTWEDVSKFIFVDSTAFSTRSVAAGRWQFMIKTVDSAKQEAAEPVVKVIDIISDGSQFFVGDFIFGYDQVNSSNIHVSNRRQLGTYYISSTGNTVESLFPNLGDNYTDNSAYYDTANVSEFVSDIWDLGAISDADTYAGTFTADFSGVVALDSGATFTTYIDTSLDGNSWESYQDTEIAAAEAGFVRVRVRATSFNGFAITKPISIKLDVVTKRKTGRAYAQLTGPTRVMIGDNVAFYNAILMQAEGLNERKMRYDTPVTGAAGVSYVDFYMFDAADNQVVGGFSYSIDYVG